MLKALHDDEFGVVLSAELVLVLTIAVLAMVSGLNEVATAINTELNDLSNAFGHLNQSYRVTGFNGFSNNSFKVKNSVAGSTWIDAQDDCDNNISCDLVCGAAGVTTSGNNLNN
ncbi:MAG: hypothetical protein CMJ78_23100 [Planctomycetaceae bacterium]|nr:hypothetical protein [Planctomycetaceae bacterium]